MKMMKVNDNYSSTIGVDILIDLETGVNYINFNGLCPRYKRDGTIYVSSQEEIAKLKNSKYLNI